MATRTTDFPDAPEILAFRAVEAILREDPVLAGRVKSFRTWDGTQMDGVPIASGECPAMRLSPEILAADSAVTLGKSRAHFGVKVEVFVAGKMAEDIVNFWAAVRAAMVRTKQFRGTTIQCFLEKQVGITRSLVTQPGFGSWTDPNGGTPLVGLGGVGRIEIDILVNA